MTNRDDVPSEAFEQWASEEGINNFHFNHCGAAWQADLAAQTEVVPTEVMAALDRMCTPLDESVLKGATAEADAHSMKVIRDYVMNRRAPTAEQADAVRRYQWLHRRAVMVDYSDETATKLTLFKDEGPSGEFLDDWIDGQIAASSTGDQA